MRTLDALKKLAAKLTNKNVSNVTGSTVDEVIEFAQANFEIAEANTAHALVLEDSEGALYDVEVTTKGALKATPRSKVANPTFDPVSGTTFAESQSVELACATEGATIYYTVDGSDPTKESSVYSEAISLSATTTIKAFADKANMTDSDIVSATYTKTE